MSDRQPTELDPIALAVDALQTEIRTIVPAEIVSYTPTTQRASVQPAIRCLTTDGKALELPQVVDAPVQWPRGNGWHLHWPLAKGDTVALAIADRELDLWLAQGKLVTPRTRRRHDLTDAIVLPGLSPTTKPNAKASATELTLGREDGTATIVISPAGEVTLEAASKVKLGSIAAALAVARVTDTLTSSAALAAWALVVEGAINALAPGTFTPANNFALNVATPGGMGTIATGSAKVDSD